MSIPDSDFPRPHHSEAYASPKPAPPTTELYFAQPLQAHEKRELHLNDVVDTAINTLISTTLRPAICLDDILAIADVYNVNKKVIDQTARNARRHPGLRQVAPREYQIVEQDQEVIELQQEKLVGWAQDIVDSLVQKNATRARAPHLLKELMKSEYPTVRILFTSELQDLYALLRADSRVASVDDTGEITIMTPVHEIDSARKSELVSYFGVIATDQTESVPHTLYKGRRRRHWNDVFKR